MRLIDADVLKEKLEKTADINNQKFSYDSMMIAKIMIQMLNKAPTVEERKYGLWLRKPLAGQPTVRCSYCRTVFGENSEKFAYCPYCGAKMYGDNND